MNSANEFSNSLPLLYILAAILLSGLGIEAFIKRKQVWGIPALTVYATIALWYFVELTYSPQFHTEFSVEIIETGYLQVIIFLLCFRLFLPPLSKKFFPKRPITYESLTGFSVNPSRILGYFSIIWLLLLLYGASRLNWNFIQALFPVSARHGSNMWMRAAGSSAGASGFIISAAGYTYMLVCAFFGILLPLQTQFTARLINLALVLISWPLFLLGGARNSFLAVVMPAYFTYTLLSKHKWWIKAVVSVALLIVLNYVFTVVIAYRNIGFANYFNDLNQGVFTMPKTQHQGLNMLEELLFINSFYEQGDLQLQYGVDYVTEVFSIIPRTIWHEKPVMGQYYNLLRGFGSSKSDIGVFATISAGCIGRGILNFGPWFGPIAPAFLLALWSAFLGRLWSQRYSILRLCLFLIGLGITPNLGRDITLLVLWPMVFGYIIVRFFEYLNKKKLMSKNLSLQYLDSIYTSEQKRY